MPAALARVADYLIVHPQAPLTLSIGELAEQAGTSAASAPRGRRVNSTSLAPSGPDAEELALRFTIARMSPVRGSVASASTAGTLLGTSRRTVSPSAVCRSRSSGVWTRRSWP